MSRTTKRSTKIFRIGAPPQGALRSREIWSTPQRHPSTITSMSQPNPCLSYSPNSRIKSSIRKSPCLFSVSNNATATILFQAMLGLQPFISLVETQSLLIRVSERQDNNAKTTNAWRSGWASDRRTGHNLLLRLSHRKQDVL